MKKEERRKKYNEIRKRMYATRRNYGKNCKENGICFVIEKIWSLFYPEDIQFIKEFHGRMPENTISIQKKLTTTDKNNPGKSFRVSAK